MSEARSRVIAPRRRRNCASVSAGAGGMMRTSSPCDQNRTFRLEDLMTVREPLLRFCRMSPAITANGVISIRSRLTRFFPGPFAFNTLRCQRNARWHEMGSTCSYACEMRHLSGRNSSATMNKMKNLLLLAAAAMLVATAAPAQEFHNEPSLFIQAKLAASDGHFDEALSLMDKVIAADPNDAVLLFERASMLLDAGKMDKGEAELRKVVTLKPDFYDAQRLLG